MKRTDTRPVMVKNVQIGGRSGFNEVETIRGRYYLRDFSDFSSFKDCCGE